MTFKLDKMKKGISFSVIWTYLFFIALSSLGSINNANAVKFDYIAPTLSNSVTWTEKVKTDTTKNDIIYTDKDWNLISADNANKLKKINDGRIQDILHVATNINFQWFTTLTGWTTKTNTPLLYGYLYKNWLNNYNNINPYSFYYGWYYYYFRNNNEYSYTTAPLDLNKNYKTRFIQKFRTHDLWDHNDEKIEAIVDWQKITLNLSQTKSSLRYNWNPISKHVYFNDNNELIWPNVFNTKYGAANNDIPHNLSFVIKSKDNWNWTSNLNIELQKQINKNVIVWNWNWSEYDLVTRQHLWASVNNDNKLYGYIGQLYNKYNWDNFSTSNWNYIVWSVNGNHFYDSPRMYASIVPQFSSRTDYFLPVEIYNWTIIMDVHPNHYDQIFWLVSSKDSQRRFNIVMGNNNIGEVERGDWNNNFKKICSWIIKHWYNEWYKLVYNIQTRNWKQILNLVSYWYDRDSNSWHIRKKEGSCSTVFDSDYSWWKPNIFDNHNYGKMGLGKIIIIPRDNIWKVWHPWWTISSFKNVVNNHPNNLTEFLSDVNNSVDKDETNFYWQNTYMLPMFAEKGAVLWKDWKISSFGGWQWWNLNNMNETDHYMNIIKWYFNAKTTGKYCFAVDGDDYVWTYIDWKSVAERTGGHGYDKSQGKYHNWCITLTKWFHNFVGLHEEIDWGDNFYFYVKNPGDKDYHIISPAKWEIYSTIFTNHWIDYKTTDTYFNLPIKNVKNKSLAYTITNSKNILVNWIKYYWITKSKIWITLLKDYAYKLLLNRNTSIYNDDLEQDINSYNSEFWLDNTWLLNYNLLSSIDRIWGIRNFWIMYGKDDMGPKNLPYSSDIPKSYYSKKRNQIGYDIDTSWIERWWPAFNPLWLKWVGYPLSGSKNNYILFSDLKEYWNYDKIWIINNVSSYTYSGDNDYRSFLYSDGSHYPRPWDTNESIDAMAESPWSSNRSKENTVYLHNNDKYFHLTFPNDRGFKIDNNYIYNPTTSMITQNDKMGYTWNGLSSFKNSYGWDIWMFRNDNDWDHSYLRTKSYYNNFKIYTITINSNLKGLWLTKSNPALSCSAIYDIDKHSMNWYYWIKLDNSHIYKLFCDFREPFKGATEYVNIKWNYSTSNAKKCFDWQYILTDKLECYNPNRYTNWWVQNVNNLIIFNDFDNTTGGYWIYDLKNKKKATNIKTTSRQRTSIGNKEWMTYMGTEHYYVRLGLNYTFKGDREYGWIDLTANKYMNYSDWTNKWETPWSRESNAKDWKIFWK